MNPSTRSAAGVSIVNDWMIYLNATYGQQLPVLANAALPDVVVALWHLTVNLATPQPLPVRVSINPWSVAIAGGGTITLKNLALDVAAGGACSIEGTLEYQGSAGSVSVDLKSGDPKNFADTQFTFNPVTLSDVWAVLHGIFNDAHIPFPDLPGGIWGFIDRALVAPTIWIPPSPDDLSSYFELQFNPALAIPGTVGGGGSFTYKISPTVSFNSIIVSYTPGQGVQFYTKISVETDPAPPGPSLRRRVASPQTTKTELVAFPPSLPTQDFDGILQFKYLGIGQRVGPEVDVSPDAPDPLGTIFSQIEGYLTGSDPATLLQNLASHFYQPDRNWFVAADFILLKSFRLRVLINDPTFYGLEITDNPDNPLDVWKGFLFEILYEKISSNLGAFYGALTLPTIMRRIPMDGFILILPGFSIWIYTNGDFRLNVGWPIGSNSIGVQIGPLTGLAGFYIEKLRSADFPGAHPVDFNPILGLGFGVQISISASVNAGIFSGGWYVGVGSTFQGLIAWKGSSPLAIASPPDHYWFAGTANLSILVWGDVDFGIVQASVSASLSAGIGVAFETGCSTIVAVSASISASASVKVGFVHIHFSFSTGIRETFTIGSGPAASVAGPKEMGLPTPGLTAFAGDDIFAGALSWTEDATSWEWPGGFVDVLSASPPAAIDVTFVLHPTVVYSGAIGTVNIIASLAVDCPTSDLPVSPHHSPTGFERLVQHLINWLLTLAGPSGVTSPHMLSDQLARIKAVIGPAGSDPQGGMPAFVDALKAYLQANVPINIKPADNKEFDGALLPMFDVLALQPGVTGATKIDFGSYNIAPGDYTAAVKLYFQDMRAVGFNPPQGASASAAASSPMPQWSMAAHAFADYFLLLCRHIVGQLQAAALQYESQNLNPATELQSLVGSFGYASAAGIASRFMLYGLQLPDPNQIPANPTPQNMAAVPTFGLYSLTGQQFPVPASELATGSVSATLSLSGAAPPGWISFPAGNPVTSQIAVPRANAIPNQPSPGWSIFTGQGSPPLPSVPDQFEVAPLLPVVPQQLAFGLTNLIDWIRPDLTHSTIYPLPQPLCDRAASGPIEVKLQIDPGPGQSPFAVDTGGQAPTPKDGKPALLIRLSVTEVRSQTPGGGPVTGSPSTGYVPYVYQLNAADQLTRDLIWQALQDASLSQASITLLYTRTGEGSPPAPPALLSDNLNATVLLAKSNLSVENQVPVGALARMFATPPQPDWAPLSDPAGFLRIVWEQCVVNAPGFLLYYETSDGRGLPADIFAQTAAGVAVAGTGGPTAEFDILVEFSRTPTASIPVTPFVNCVVVDETPDPTWLLNAHACDAHGNPLVSYAPSYPAGTVGFELLWLPPTVPSPAPPIPVDSLYHLVQYQIAGANGFNPSVWSLPVGPTDLVGAQTQPLVWTYKQIVPVTKFLPTASPQIDPYAAIGMTVDIDFRLTDIYGNALTTAQRAAFACRYNDPLIPISHWKGVLATYAIMPGGVAGPAALTITLVFDPDLVLPRTNPPLLSGDESTYWTLILTRYGAILAQLRDPNTEVVITSSLTGGGPLPRAAGGSPDDTKDELIAFVQDVIDSIQDLQDSSPQAPVRTCALDFQVPFAAIGALSTDIFEVTITIGFSRTQQVDPYAAQQLPSIENVSYIVAPDTAPSPGSPPSSTGIANFAANFEKAFAQFDGAAGMLKLTRRVGVTTGTDNSPSPDLWAVRFSANQGIAIDPIDDSDITYFAVPPLSTVPISQQYTSSTTGVTTTYTNVDLDLWAEEFLRALDNFFTPQMCAAVAILDKRLNKSNFQALAAVKRQLAKAIAARVEPIFKLSAPPNAFASAAASAALEQALLVQLSNAFSVSTIVQAAANVTAVGQADDGSPGEPPQLCGKLGSQNVGSPSTNLPYTFSNPTLNVAAGDQYITSLLTVREPSGAAWITLDLSYQITHLQHDFETKESFANYVPSSWLKFIIPPDQIMIPANGLSFDIPVPLPFLPTPPTLQTQTAMQVNDAPRSPSPPIGQEIEDALKWNYHVTLATQMAAQDELYFTVTYNQTDPQFRALAVDSLFAALAEFQETYPAAEKIAEILAEAYGASAPGSSEPTIELVINIAQAIANAWPSSQSRADAVAGSISAADYFYMSAANNSVRPSAVDVTLHGRSTVSSPQAPLYWPTVTLPYPGQWTPPQLQDGWYAARETVTVASGSPSGSNTSLVGEALASIDLLWSNLDVLDVQSASFTCYLTRNAKLDHAGTPVNSAFKYLTQPATFSTPAVPLIERQQLTMIVPGPSSLEDVLEQVLTPFARVSHAVVDLRYGYGYELVPKPGSPPASGVTATTTFMRPTQLTVPSLGSPSRLADLARDLAGEIRAIYNAKPLPTRAAELHLAVSLSVSTSGGQTTLLAQLYDIPISVPDGWL